MFYESEVFKNFVRDAKAKIGEWQKRKVNFLIYGAGEHSAQLLKHIDMKEGFLGFIDKSEIKRREGFLGYKVYSPIQIVNRQSSIVNLGIIISSYEYQDAIYRGIKELETKGVEIVRLYKKGEKMEAFRGLYEGSRGQGVKGSSDFLLNPHTLESSNPSFPNRRIAVVDSFFSWPPTGGSAVDLMGLMNGLAEKGFEITFFLPLVEDELFFPAGLVNGNGDMKFKIVQMPIKLSQYNKLDFPKIISEAVDNYKPEFVFLGDMYSFKPYVAERLNKYKTIWRFYAYGLICPKCTLSNGDGGFCSNTYFDDMERCKNCIKDKLEAKADEPIYRELREADIFSGDYETLLKNGLEKAYFIVVYNNIQKEILSKFIRNTNIAVIPTGIDVAKFQVSDFDSEISTPGSETKTTILMNGRVSDPAKGFSTLHKAFLDLKEKHKNIRLLVTSKYDFKEEGIESTGWVPFDEIYRLYDFSDICVIPSKWEEPFGIVALEAMASGKPVVASRVGGLKDIVVDGETGFLVENGDVDGFTEKVALLIENKSLRAEMGMKGIERAREYEWEQVIDMYKEVFTF
ncbi:MAG: glycosyltransferase family 4 protein [Nitrospinae bacterium]|nr:glycosyltransferase family 4 protein [Nitrospinota bacterium]